jgi:Lon protease-like protein
VPQTREVAETIALVPLDYVLLPGVPLPLHVFEPRYRQLVSDVGRHGSFGVVLGHAGAQQSVAPSRRGTGPDGREHRVEPELAAVGTVAEIVENDQFADGRCDLLTVGTRRYRILDVDADSQPYLQARVEFLDEPAGDDPGPSLARVAPMCAAYLAELAKLVDHGLHGELADEPVCASYEIAARLQLTTGDRQELLAIGSAGQRLRAEARLIRRELALLRTIRAVPVSAQTLRIPAGVN